MTAPSLLQPPATAVPFAARKNSVAEIIRENWHARDLLVQFVKRDITVRYAQAIMGLAWALFMPLLIVCSGLVFRVVVSRLAGTPVGGVSAAALAVKALPWAFFSGAIALATQSIIAHANLIGKIYFPREALPIAAVLAQGLDLLIGLAALVVVLPFLGVTAHASLLWAPLVLLLLIVFTVGCALLLSCWNLFYRDIKYIVQVALNFGIFATPIFFEPQMLGERGAAVMMALPLSPFIQALDLSAVRGHSLLEPLFMTTRSGNVQVWAPWMLLYMIVLALGTFGFGLRVFRRASSRFAEVA